MFTVAVPGLLSVTVCDCVVPSATLPKDSVAGFEDRTPAEGVAPAPLSATMVWASLASLPIVIVALNDPVVLGVNARLIGVLCPAAIETGRLGAVTAKYLVEIETLETLTVAVPVLVAVTEIVLVLPGDTLPKASDGFGSESVPKACVEFPVLTPWQPARKLKPARSRSTPATFTRIGAEIPFAGALGFIRNRPFPLASISHPEPGDKFLTSLIGRRDNA